MAGQESVPVLDIGERRVGRGHACFITAEAGVNHNGDPALAVELIDAAKSAGADAVKFQTFTPSSVVSAGAPKADYQRETTDPAQSQLAMLEELRLSDETFRRLKDHADRVGVLFLSTPYDARDVDFLVGLGVPALKVASLDIANPLLLKHMAGKGLPMLVSTGMAAMDEIDEAVQLIRRSGDPPHSSSR